MTDHAPLEMTSWADSRTAVLAQGSSTGPIVVRGDRLFAGLNELRLASQVRTLADARSLAGRSPVVKDWLEAYEENAEFDDLVITPETDVSEEFNEYFIELMSLPWVHTGRQGWELDGLVRDHATVSGAMPGGGADVIEFNLSLGELAARLREFGYRTVEVSEEVMLQFLDFPISEIRLEEGQELT